MLTGLIVVITEYFTGMYGPVKYVAQASTTGHGTNIIAGLAISMISTVLPVLVLAGLHHDRICDLAVVSPEAPEPDCYGIAVVVVSMLSMTGIVVAID